jgi:U3 small nucleolar RNA-associated protein 14
MLLEFRKQTLINIHEKIKRKTYRKIKNSSSGKEPGFSKK